MTSEGLFYQLTAISAILMSLAFFLRKNPEPACWGLKRWLLRSFEFPQPVCLPAAPTCPNPPAARPCPLLCANLKMKWASGCAYSHLYLNVQILGLKRCLRCVVILSCTSCTASRHTVAVGSWACPMQRSHHCHLMLAARSCLRQMPSFSIAKSLPNGCHHKHLNRPFFSPRLLDRLRCTVSHCLRSC